MILNVIHSKNSIAEQLQRFTSTPTMFDDDHNFKCYFYCIINTSNGVAPNGKLDSAAALKRIEQLEPEEQIIMLNMGKKCMAQKEKDICDRFYNVFRCMKTSDMTHFFVL